MLRRNVLIFHTGALGDFVLSWPLALAAGRLFPQSRIIYVTHAQKGALAERALRVEWADIEVGWQRLFADGELPPAAGKTLAGAHTVFSFFSQPVDAWSANLRAVNAEAMLLHLRTQPAEGYAGHASQFLLEQLRDFPAIAKAVEQMLRSIADRGVGLRKGGQNTVIHPGSGSRAKCWPITRFAELAQRLRAAGHDVRFVTGEVERERFSDADFKQLSRIASVKTLDSHLELLRELSDARLFIGNDSGPSHLAGIIGVPTVAIFAAASADVWHPLGPDVRIARGASMDQIEVDEVYGHCEK